MVLYIKYMLSLSCISIVRAELEKLNVEHGVIELGAVKTHQNLSENKLKIIKAALKKHNFLLMDNPTDILIEKIKNLIIEMIHYRDELPTQNYSVYISEKLGYDYTYLANVFSEFTGFTLEHYIISHKMEKVKELLIYDELSLTQISYRLGYSSVGYLSRQFKKETGLTPTFYKKLKHKRRILMENIGA